MPSTPENGARMVFRSMVARISCTRASPCLCALAVSRNASSDVPRGTSPGRLTEEQPQRVLGKRDLALEAGDLAGRRVEQLLGLAYVEPARQAAAAPRLGQPQAVVARVARPRRDLELEIEGTQREVVLGDVGDERGEHSAPRFVTRQVLRARRLIQPADASPDIEFPAQAEPGLGEGDVVVHTGRQRRAAAPRQVRRGLAGDRVHGRELIGARDAVDGTCLQDTLGRDAQLEVLFQRRRHQRGERVVAEEIEPLSIGQRFAGVRAGAAIRRRYFNVRALVVRTDGARETVSRAMVNAASHTYSSRAIRTGRVRGFHGCWSWRQGRCRPTARRRSSKRAGFRGSGDGYIAVMRKVRSDAQSVCAVEQSVFCRAESVFQMQTCCVAPSGETTQSPAKAGHYELHGGLPTRSGICAAGRTAACA